MKVMATFDLPMDEEMASMAIERAREIGLPLLAVVVQIDDSDILDFALARGASREQIEGFALGQRISELRESLTTLGHYDIKFFGAEILPEDSPAALAYEPLTPAPIPAAREPGKKRKTRA